MSPHRFCVAPMLDHTDRHCRYFHRQLSRHARLYTEMVTTGALLHGPRERLLRFDEAEHPVALQLGGSEPEDLAQAARLGEQAGYDEIDLNCGCPSERVQRGSFGACLMAEPKLVADCVRAMRDAVSIPVTVKHRIGLDRVEDYGFVRDFVGTVSQAGCEVFIVHARNAWLKGLSPRENRTVPPLRYETVARLKRDFPGLTIVLNGGLRDHATAIAHLSQVDGVMIGREACDNPWMLAEVDARYFGQPAPHATREEAVDAMRGYLSREVAAGVPARAVVRPMIGLFNGLPGARNWRRALSDPSLLESAGPRILDRALQAMRAPSGAPRARTEEFQ
jgi:tRNA-dihydrouridine synthase A